ncbi:hypothetical protein LTS09_006395 [Friedmanniomyces endolithicus]|nr:hypothetical protein LTS09_006395 [Friedmanniomyces endolithicus]
MKFTPEVLLSAPRRSPGVPNPSGTRVLYSSSAYDFDTHKKTVELRLLDVETDDSHLLAEDEDVSDFNWLDDEHLVCLQAEKDETTNLRAFDVSKVPESAVSHYLAGKIAASASNLKVCKLDEEAKEVAIVVSAQALPDGSLLSPTEANKKTHSTGRLYSKLYVRHWDQYEGKAKNALWCGQLSRGPDGEYKLGELTNVLKGSGLECPIAPFGGTDHFDIRREGLIFVAKDPELNPALNTKSNVYLLYLGSWTGNAKSTIEPLPIGGYEGAATCPVFDAKGKQAAFLQMRANGYEADANVLFLMFDVDSRATKSAPQFTCIAQDASEEEGDFWSRSAQSICFSADGNSLLAVAEDRGASKLYQVILRSDKHQIGYPALTLASEGYVSDVRALSDARVFMSRSSLIDNSSYAILSHWPSPKAHSPSWTHSNTSSGAKFGLNSKQVSSIWTPASNPKITKEVHSIVVRPSNFDKAKKYPVAYLIHGGPQGSWADSWSTRWNPAVFAEQGYIVVAPNVTGSTGYGQKFTDAIRNNWGGDPYHDIVNCFDWVGENMPEADNSRAVALGASYGGYMMNWIQGHDLGRKFKALVCHDGILTFAGAMLATEELYFPFHDLGGTPWYDPGFNAAGKEAKGNFGSSTLSDWKRWDPSEHLDKWATPQLVIHNEKDYRLPISEGLAPFNVLQARGIESQFLTFPDESQYRHSMDLGILLTVALDHFVLKPENSLVWHKVVLNWINKHVGLPPYTTEDPDGDEFWGGVRDGNAELAELPIQGKPET